MDSLRNGNYKSLTCNLYLTPCTLLLNVPEMIFIGSTDEKNEENCDNWVCSVV